MLKLYFAAFFAVDISLIAWLAQNYRKAEIILTASSVTAIIAITTLLTLLHVTAYKRVNRLEKF